MVLTICISGGWFGFGYGQLFPLLMVYERRFFHFIMEYPRFGSAHVRVVGRALKVGLSAISFCEKQKGCRFYPSRS
tara:strand:+ start:9710 stop:9937 length:228 start_codon:yes stop_codon:yes gene_type:complete